MAVSSSGTRKTVADDIFRDMISRFASGVTVITTTADDGDHGTTASAVSSLSMDPPMLLICLNKTSDTRAAIVQSGVFGVNVLAEHQGDIAYKFAKKGTGKFAGVDTLRGRTGIPLVQNALAHFECEVEETVTGGTHSVFLARVKEASGTDAPPAHLLPRTIRQAGDARDDAAYRDLRQRVIERTLPVGDVLDIDRLAAELDVEAPHVYHALTKLAADNLVARRQDAYVVTH